MKDVVTVRVEVEFPWTQEIMEYRYAVSADQWRGALSPIRHVPDFDIRTVSNYQQIEKRARLARLLGEALANGIVTACESQDTDAGGYQQAQR